MVVGSFLLSCDILRDACQHRDDVQAWELHLSLVNYATTCAGSVDLLWLIESRMRRFNLLFQEMCFGDNEGKFHKYILFGKYSILGRGRYWRRRR